MNSFKVIKTTFDKRKELIGFHFYGEDDYNLFISEVKRTYNLPIYSEVWVYTKGFFVKPELFSHLVAQYINNLDFVLDIKLSETTNCVQENTLLVDPVGLQHLPTTEEIRQLRDVRDALKLRVLENKHRTKIAKALIACIQDKQPDRKLLRDDFLQLTQSIVDIFPLELRETYYIPFQKGRLARGKLYDAYNNSRSRLRAAGVIRRQSKFVPEENNTPDNSNICIDESAYDLDECELEILQSGCAEWDLIVRAWRKSHYFRQNELQNENLTRTEYFAKYQVLLDERNYELFDIDFKILYPTSKNIYEWKLYYRKVMAMAQKLHDSTVKEILANIENTEDEDIKLTLSLMLVPYLLPNNRQTSKFEVQESFICFYQDTAKEHDVKRLKTECEPKVYLIGDSDKNICFAYVDISGTRLEFKNPLRAIEVCFQSFLTMNIKYPHYCSRVWLFIQKLIFEVHTLWDAVIPSVNTLINDLQSDGQIKFSA